MVPADIKPRSIDAIGLPPVVPLKVCVVQLLSKLKSPAGLLGRKLETRLRRYAPPNLSEWLPTRRAASPVQVVVSKRLPMIHAVTGPSAPNPCGPTTGKTGNWFCAANEAGRPSDVGLNPVEELS